MKLYDLPIIWANIESDLDAAAGELTPEIEARIKSLMVGGADKLDAAMCVVKSLEAQSNAAAEEAQRLYTRAASFAKNAERLRSMILPALIALGGKVKTARFSFSTQTRDTIAFEIRPGTEFWELPTRFIRVPPTELNKIELKKAEAAGETLPDGLAVVKSTSTSLMVR